MALAVAGRPNCALPNVVFQLGKRDVVDRVGGINPQITAQPVAQSERAASEAFKVNCAGPVMESRPALPH